MDTLAPESRDAHSGPTLTVFLSLYLILLAFFIFIVAQSRFELSRAVAAMSSVAGAFRGDAGLVRWDGEMASPTAVADVVAGLRSELQRQFDSGLPEARLIAGRDGSVLRASVPVGALFAAGESTLRADKRTIVAELGRVLGTVPAGFAFRIEISLPRGNDLTAGQRLPVIRAGALARHLEAEGLAPTMLATGLRPGEGGEVQFTVFVRPDDGRPGALRD